MSAVRGYAEVAAELRDVADSRFGYVKFDMRGLAREAAVLLAAVAAALPEGVTVEQVVGERAEYHKVWMAAHAKVNALLAERNTIHASLPDCPTCGGTCGWLNDDGHDYTPCPDCDHGKVTVEQLAALWEAVHGDKWREDIRYADQLATFLRSVRS